PAIARLAAFAARQLLQDTRIAAFSLTGWDTHVNQQANLPRALVQLQTAVLTLRRNLGPAWAETCVLAMTEFGRTAAENGAGGTDHGTAGLMLVAGGRVRGGRVYGPWPGLDEADLYDRRDLRPTTDLRAWAGWAVRALYGLDRATVERQVFPGLDLGTDPGLVA
ncbi:MAG: DUF1501 domain-containing protein, partial [Rhodobacterales bacterium]|nr:DUF1501 domain-containing protein [Rhodobacterales bacterium]